MKTLKVITLSLLVLLATNSETVSKDHCGDMALGTSILISEYEAGNSEKPLDAQCYFKHYQVFLIYTFNEAGDRNLTSMSSKKWFGSLQQHSFPTTNHKPQLLFKTSRPFYKPEIYIQVQSFLL